MHWFLSKQNINNVMINYSRAFKILRSVYTFEQRDLARLVNVNPSYISRIESGKQKPSDKLLFLLCKKLKIPRELLLLLGSESNKNANEETKKRIGELLLGILNNEKKTS